MKCGFCSEEVDMEDLEVVSGLHVCKSCIRATYLPGRLTAKGLHLGYSYRTEHGEIKIGDEEEIDGTLRKISALAESPHLSGIQAKLMHQGLGARLKKLVEKELEIGDKEFDDAVYIRSSTRDQTAAFLAISGVQSAVLQLIRMNSEIDINGSKIYIVATNKGPIEVQTWVLHVAALLHYLAEFSSPTPG